MNKRNYQKELEMKINAQEKEGTVPTLFLHSCCAPCSSYCLEYLSQYYKITVFYYNPNIYPEEEYYKRVKEQQEFIRKFPAKHQISFVEGNYDSARYYEAVKGLEKEPERGARCSVCFRLRLEEAAKMAVEHKQDYFATTLTLSPLKDAELINTLGEPIGEAYGVKYLSSDFKKKNGYKRSIELSKEYDLYRQNYCGCVFSRRGEETDGRTDQ